MKTDIQNDAQAIIDAARESWGAQAIPGMDGMLAVSKTGGIAIENHTSRLFAPPRKQGEITVYDPASLIRYLNDQGATAACTAIYMDADPENPAITAILNSDSASFAGWRDHRVQIGFRETPQWRLFKSKSDKLMSGMDFASFIEENRRFFITPEASDLMHIVQNFEVSSNTKTKQGIRLGSGGIQFTYVDDPEAKIPDHLGKQYTVPQSFKLALRPYQGSSTYTVEAMFRWRHSNGVLSFGFKLMDVEKIIEDAVNDFVGKISSGVEYKQTVTNLETGEVTQEVVAQIKLKEPIPVYSGIAPAPTRL